MATQAHAGSGRNCVSMFAICMPSCVHFRTQINRIKSGNGESVAFARLVVCFGALVFRYIFPGGGSRMTFE